MPFYDVMLETIFGTVWDRPELSIRDRRLLVMGAIAAFGSTETWKVQARSALDRGELTPSSFANASSNSRRTPGIRTLPTSPPPPRRSSRRSRQQARVTPHERCRHLQPVRLLAARRSLRHVPPVAEEAPAYWNEELRFWVLSRFDDVQDAFRDHETFSSAGGVALEARRPVGSGDASFQQMIDLDPPDHTAFRSIVSRFTGRRVLAMEDEVRRIVDGYIDQVIEAGSCDLVNDISGPFPMDVISAVLGIPEHDRDALRVSADKILIREDGSMQIPEEAMNGMFELLGYFVQDLESRRAGDRTGLITDLLDAEVDGRKLNEQELLGFCVLFVIAGHETTTKMVANAVELLSRHPDQQALLAGEPERVATAVEEVLRFHNSTQYMHRTLTTDIERHGQTMRAGDSVLLLIGAANHDEREFGESAEVFDVTRTPTGTLASAMAPTSAWVRRSPASKGVSPSSRSTPVCPTTSSITNTRCASFLQRHGLDEPPITFSPGPRVGAAS